MNSTRRAIAALELLLIGPALLFMTALFVRNLSPRELEPAVTAQRVVLWYSGQHQLGYALLTVLPLAVLVTGSITLARSWSADSTLRQATLQVLAAVRAHLASFLVALATASAVLVLAAVAVHALTS